MSTDKQVVDKAMGTLSKIILGVFVAPISIASLYWVFSTTLSNNQSIALIQQGQTAIVKAIDRNTDTIKEANKNNADDHAILAEMIHGTDKKISTSNARIDALKEEIHEVEEDCDTHRNGDH